MTENTKVLGIRLENDKKERLSKYLNRESAEALLRQIERGEIDLTLKGVVFKRVNTKSQGVNTTSEPVSNTNAAIDCVNTTSESVNTYDPDGEWVRKMAHDLNISVESFKRKIEWSARL